MPPLNVHVIDDEERLNALKNICFTAKDLRAGWIGPGLPKTNQPEFQALAKWATEHWYMYESFVPEISIDTSNILDIGCGIGHSTINLATLFPKMTVTAVDSDAAAIEFAKRYNSKDNISYVAQDFFRFKSDEKFQYIFCLEIFEHLPPELHDVFMEQCLSLLKPTGKMFMTTPNALDERDADYGHIGMLNRQRTHEFYKRYQKNIIQESFINNTKLLTGRAQDFTIRASFNTYEQNADHKSHFRLILQTTPETQSLPKSWPRRYFFISTRLRLRHNKNGLLRLSNRLLARVIPLIPEPLRKIYRKIFKRIPIKENIFTPQPIIVPAPNTEPPVNWHEDFIVHLASILQPAVYVELGLYQCELFNRIVPYAKKLIGIDTEQSAGTFMETVSGKSEFFHGSTDDFAKVLAEKDITIDLLFIDANHSKESVMTDFRNYFPHVADQGIILFHDAYPKSNEYTKSGYCGDGWKAIDELARQAAGYEMVTIPRHPGVAICRKRTKQLPWI